MFHSRENELEVSMTGYLASPPSLTASRAMTLTEQGVSSLIRFDWNDNPFDWAP